MRIIETALSSPTGEALGNTEIRVSVISSPKAIPNTTAVVTTSSDGSYDFSLEAGIYTIEVKYKEIFLDGTVTKEKFNLTGTVELPESSATTSLAQLLSDYKYTPEEAVEATSVTSSYIDLDSLSIYTEAVVES